MTTEDSTTRVVADSGADVGPGERLREAREAAQLTVSEVASRLRLEPRVIDRLENDDFEQLHGPTFVRGYLSGYARLLDLPEGPILEAYERHGFGPPALVSELGRKPEVHVSDFPVRMVTYVIAGLLVVLVVLWWQSRQPDTATSERAESTARSASDTSAEVADATGRDETSVSPSASSAGTPVAESAARTVSESKAAVPETREPEVASAAADTTSQGGAAERPTQPAQSMVEAQDGDNQPMPVVTFADDVAETGETPEPVQTETTPIERSAAGRSDDAGSDATRIVMETTGGDTGGSETATADAAMDVDADDGPASPDGEDVAEAAPAPRPAPLPGSDVLAIQLSRESWIEIYDRGGGRLYYSLAEEGSEIVVQGAGPMRVLLGEVQGAVVAYNGEPYDLSRFEGRSVVRFTVGELSGTATPEPPAVTEEPPAPETQEPTAEAQDQSVADAGDTASAPAATPAAVKPAPQPETSAPADENEPAVAPSRPDS